MKKMALVLCCVGLLLGGCAATVSRSDTAAMPLRVSADSARKIVLNVTGAPTSTQSKDWGEMVGTWQTAMRAESAAAGIDFATQAGAPRAERVAGTLVNVHVNDYRFLSTGARFGLGVFTGNAFIDAKVRFSDLKSGAPIGERSYNTSSSAWQGVFSAMTDKQVHAISREIIKEIRGR